MTASGLEVQLLLRAGAELVADIERTMREGGKAPVHIGDVKRWHAEALAQLAATGRFGADPAERFGAPADYVDDRDISLSRGRIRAVIGALEYALAPAGAQAAAPGVDPAYHVFISYSDLDGTEAEAVHAALQARGYRAFLARKSLKPGDDFAKEIRQALLGSSQLWLLVSPHSVQSEWVLTEWGAAWVLGRRIVPILLNVTRNILPARLKALHTERYDNFPLLIDGLG